MSSFSLFDSSLDGVKILSCPFSSDLRGTFVKTFHAQFFLDLGISFTPAESFISTSDFGVIRGMHYQSSSYAHDKLIFCICGKVLDVIVDIRPESPQFNKPISFELNSEESCAVFIPKGYAHGFLSLSPHSSLLYLTSTVHNPLYDCGVLWSSIDFKWPVTTPILSERDRKHPSIDSLK